MRDVVTLFCPLETDNSKPVGKVIDDDNMIDNMLSSQTCPICNKSLVECDPNADNIHSLKEKIIHDSISATEGSLDFDRFSSIIEPVGYRKTIISFLKTAPLKYQKLIYYLFENNGVSHIFVCDNICSQSHTSSQNRTISLNKLLDKRTIFHEIGHAFNYFFMSCFNSFKTKSIGSCNVEASVKICKFFDEKYHWSEINEIKTKNDISMSRQTERINTTKIPNCCSIYNDLVSYTTLFLASHYPLMIDVLNILNSVKNCHYSPFYNSFLQGRASNYWTNTEYISLEFFAHMFAMHAMNDSLQIEASKTIFPDVFDEYDCLISNITNDKIL